MKSTTSRFTFLFYFACVAAINILVLGAIFWLPDPLLGLAAGGWIALQVWLCYKAGIIGRGGGSDQQEGPGGSAEWKE